MAGTAGENGFGAIQNRHDEASNIDPADEHRRLAALRDLRKRIRSILDR